MKKDTLFVYIGWFIVMYGHSFYYAIKNDKLNLLNGTNLVGSTEFLKVTPIIIFLYLIIGLILHLFERDENEIF